MDEVIMLMLKTKIRNLYLLMPLIHSNPLQLIFDMKSPNNFHQPFLSLICEIAFDKFVLFLINVNRQTDKPTLIEIYSVISRFFKCHFSTPHLAGNYTVLQKALPNSSLKCSWITIFKRNPFAKKQQDGDNFSTNVNPTPIALEWPTCIDKMTHEG